MSNTKIFFLPERGGLGDGIVGCSSAFILAKILDAEFKILNGPIEFYNYFNIPDNFKTNSNTKYIYNYEPNLNNDKLFKESDLSVFKNKSVIIKAGSNFSRFLYKNPIFKNKIDIDETSVIQYLFKNILIPKKQYLEKLDFYVTKYDIHNSVGIQLRMLTFKNIKDNQNPLDIKTINRFIECFKKNTENNKLILVTDNLELTKPIFEKNNIKDIVNIDGEITHSTKSINKDFEKTLLDMLILGECKHVIISYWSNFGRIGALRTKHKNIWLVEPDFVDMNFKGRDWKREWRDNDDPSVINFRKANWNELLSKEKAFI